ARSCCRRAHRSTQAPPAHHTEAEPFLSRTNSCAVGRDDHRGRRDVRRPCHTPHGRCEPARVRYDVRGTQQARYSLAETRHVSAMTGADSPHDATADPLVAELRTFILSYADHDPDCPGFEALAWSEQREVCTCGFVMRLDGSSCSPASDDAHQDRV